MGFTSPTHAYPWVLTDSALLRAGLGWENKRRLVTLCRRVTWPLTLLQDWLRPLPSFFALFCFCTLPRSMLCPPSTLVHHLGRGPAHIPLPAGSQPSSRHVVIETLTSLTTFLLPCWSSGLWTPPVLTDLPLHFRLSPSVPSSNAPRQRQSFCLTPPTFPEQAWKHFRGGPEAVQHRSSPVVRWVCPEPVDWLRA